MSEQEIIFTLRELGPIEGFEESVVTERTITDEELEEEEKRKEKRKSLVSSIDKMVTKPFDIMNRMEDAERILEQMKPGAYYVVINYKKKGAIELKRNARNSDSQKVVGIVEKEEKQTKAAVHRFVIAVRKAYESGSEMIGRTHAIKSFGQRMVDSVPHVKELVNNYYKSAAPRRLYDRQTLLYLKVSESEQ